MSYKHFLSFLLVLVFSCLVACGSSDSKSSGDKEKANSGSQKPAQETNQDTVKDCVKGDNPLKEGESCKVSENVYTCKNGGVQTVSGGSSISGKRIINNEHEIFCE